MPAVGMLLGLGGYGIALWGYCLVTGQNVKLTQLFNPVSIYVWGSGGKIPDTTLLPDGSSATSTPGAGTAGATPTTTNIATGTVAGANPKIVPVAGRGR
jgi:hypothetical protein